MNSLTDVVPPDGGAVPLDPLTTAEVWNTATAVTEAGNLNGGNATQLLYIAVSRKIVTIESCFCLSFCHASGKFKILRVYETYNYYYQRRQ